MIKSADEKTSEIYEIDADVLESLPYVEKLTVKLLIARGKWRLIERR